MVGFGAPCAGCTITGNTCQGNGEVGIVLVTNSDDNTVSGNTCNGNSEEGIKLQGADGCTVSGNTCNGNTRHGIYLYGSSDNTLSGNTCHRNDSGNTGTYDGIYLNISSRNIVSENNCQENDRWGIMVDTLSDYNKISMNYTNFNTSGSIRINNANSDKTQIEFNTVEEGAPSNAGTLTRAYGNYDPSANAFVGDVGAAPF
jgi:parallel beta-helix repeat protein